MDPGSAVLFPCKAWHRSGEKTRRTLTVQFFLKDAPKPDMPKMENVDVKPNIAALEAKYPAASLGSCSTDPLPPADNANPDTEEPSAPPPGSGKKVDTSPEPAPAKKRTRHSTKGDGS